MAFWLYFIFLFGSIGLFAYYFLRDPSTEKKKFEFKVGKTSGVLIASLLVSLVISFLIKYVRGVDGSFLGLYIVVSIAAFAVMYALSKWKEKKSK